VNSGAGVPDVGDFSPVRDARATMKIVNKAITAMMMTSIFISLAHSWNYIAILSG
jgi:hypothetical protein